MYSSLFLVFPQVKIISALEEESSTPIFFSRFAFLVAAAQAFKILRADSCTSDVETRMNFKKMDKYS